MIRPIQLELPALIVRHSEYSSHHRTNGHPLYFVLPSTDTRGRMAGAQGGTVDEEP